MLLCQCTNATTNAKEAMKYDPKIHHRRSIRLKGYDYSQEEFYSVTICTRKRECTLGDIVDGEIHLNEIGKCVDLCWLEIAKDFSTASLDVHQVMPNHVHGIIRILENPRSDLEESHGRDLINQIPTRNNKIPTEENQRTDIGTAPNWPLMKNPKQTLGKMIRSFKAKATKKIHDAGYPAFGWQGKFHDHIIRDGKDLDRIRKYILDNPANWENDDDFPGNIKMDNIHNEGENRWLYSDN
jgi:putative transposase